jgi:cytochrome P450
MVILSWLIYFVYSTPEVLKKAREEVDLIDEINGETVKKMGYLGKCIYETLRLNSIGKTATRTMYGNLPYECGDIKGVFEKGDIVVFAALTAYRDEKVFKDHLKFDPDRDERDKLGNLFTPFGNGMHSCQGKEFTIMMLRTVTSTLLKNYNLIFDDPNLNVTVDPINTTNVMKQEVGVTIVHRE